MYWFTRTYSTKSQLLLLQMLTATLPSNHLYSVKETTLFPTRSAHHADQEA